MASKLFPLKTRYPILQFQTLYLSAVRISVITQHFPHTSMSNMRLFISVAAAFGIFIFLMLMFAVFSSFITSPTLVAAGQPGGFFTGLRNSFKTC